MGFSISGSFAILIVASIVAFGMIYSATANKSELVNEAKQGFSDRRVATKNTDIKITNVTYQGNNLWIDVNNTGTTTLTVNDTDVLIDGEFQERPFDKEDVNGDKDTNLWQPGEELTIRIKKGSKPNRVVIVTEHGISDAKVV